MSNELNFIAPTGEEGFIDTAFRMFWDAKRVEEPTEIFSVREAFTALRNCTGLSRDTIARYLGISGSYLSKIEMGRTIVSAANYTELKMLAKSYSLPLLAKFFEDCEFKSINSSAPTKGRKLKHSTGAMPNWRDMMGE